MKKLDHVAIAVTDLDAAEAAYKNVLNLNWEGREEVTGQKVMTSIFQAGDPAKKGAGVAPYLPRSRRYRSGNRQAES